MSRVRGRGAASHTLPSVFWMCVAHVQTLEKSQPSPSLKKQNLSVPQESSCRPSVDTEGFPTVHIKQSVADKLC